MLRFPTSRMPAHVLAPHLLKLGPLGVSIVSDTHEFEVDRLPPFGFGGISLLGRLLLYLKRIDPQQPLILNGDVGVDSLQWLLYGPKGVQQAGEAAALWELIATRPGPVYIVAGNHNAGMAEVLLEQDRSALRLRNLPQQVGAEWQGLVPRTTQLRLTNGTCRDFPPLQDLTPILQNLTNVWLCGHLLVEAQNGRKVLVCHGHRFDWALPLLERVTRGYLKRKGLPPRSAKYGKSFALTGELLYRLTDSGRQYARVAVELGADEVVLGHWHCPNLIEEFDLAGRTITVRVLTCGTDSFSVAGEILGSSGLVRNHNLIAYGLGD